MTRTIYEQTGWIRRPLPVSICQDSDVLTRITEYDFDLDNLDFVKYFISRTGYDILGTDCGWKKKREFILDADDSAMERYQADAAANRKRVGKFSSYNDTWRVIERGKLQDCWELWCAGHR